MKNELGRKIMKEFVTLRPKIYYYAMDVLIKKCVIKQKTRKPNSETKRSAWKVIRQY